MKTLSLLIAALIVFTSISSAQNLKSSDIAGTIQPISIKRQYLPELVENCDHAPDLCEWQKSQQISLSDNQKFIFRVFDLVKKNIKSCKDTPGSWRFMPICGDCNDYAYSFWRALQYEIPPGALAFRRIRINRDLYHLAVAINTDKGTIILDQLEEFPVFERFYKREIVDAPSFGSPYIF